MGKLIEQVIGAGKIAGARHFGVDNDSCEISRINIVKSDDLNIAKAVKRVLRLCGEWFAAGDYTELLLCGTQVFGIDVAVTVEHFEML